MIPYHYHFHFFVIVIIMVIITTHGQSKKTPVPYITIIFVLFVPANYQPFSYKTCAIHIITHYHHSSAGRSTRPLLHCVATHLRPESGTAAVRARGTVACRLVSRSGRESSRGLGRWQAWCCASCCDMRPLFRVRQTLKSYNLRVDSQATYMIAAETTFVRQRLDSGSSSSGSPGR